MYRETVNTFLRPFSPCLLTDLLLGLTDKIYYLHTLNQNTHILITNKVVNIWKGSFLTATWIPCHNTSENKLVFTDNPLSAI